MSQDSKLKCSICYQDSPGSTCTQCSQIFTTVITSLTTKPKTPFSNIENLVFQGGGVKGAAYLGVLEQLESESEGFLKGVKRVAGSSAGSIVALYLALNLDLKDIRKLVVDEKYSTLLDNGIPLIIDGQDIIVRAKTVFLTAIEYVKVLKEEAHDKEKSPEALTKIRKIGEDILSYLMRDRWFYETFFFNKVIGDKGAEAFTSCILDLLGVGYEIEGTQDNTNDEEKKKSAQMDEILKYEIAKGFQDAQNNEIAPTTNEVVAMPLKMKTEKIVIKQEENIAGIKDTVMEAHIEKITLERQPLVNPEGASLGVGSVWNDLREWPSWIGEQIGNLFNGGGENKPQRKLEFDLSLPEDLTLLHYSLAELLKQMKIYGDEEVEYKYNKNKIQPREETVGSLNIKKAKKDPLGVFTGADVKFKLIIEPIAKVCKFGHKDYGPTFAELAEAKDENEKKIFKDLYVTAFNTATNRTEVFSAEHTPNVFVAHAVRASMSIPGFFRPVNILQKNGESTENRKIYYENKKEITPASEEILFMDGGILDNYPLWIFDDIRYLLPDVKTPAQNGDARTQRFTIQNPRTLGFKLLDQKTLNRYTEPYFNKEGTQMKRTNETSQATGNKWSFVFGSLLGSKMDQEENEFIKFGNCPRTAYVDNADVSPVAFDMDEGVVKKLIQNGVDSVKKYKERYDNSFLNEGQLYPTYSILHK